MKDVFYSYINIIFICLGIDKKAPIVSENWSGEATRNAGFQVEETRVDVTIGDESNNLAAANRKEAPIWMKESTVMSGNDSQMDNSRTTDPLLEAAENASATNAKSDDIMSVLLAHEKKGKYIDVVFQFLQ